MILQTELSGRSSRTDVRDAVVLIKDSSSAYAFIFDHPGY